MSGVRAMSDDDAFLRAIQYAPYDDAPRLVYADWLEERTDPRAEYLRLLSAPDDEAAVARIEELRRTLDPKWLALVQPPDRVEIPSYSIISKVAEGQLTTVYEAVSDQPARPRVALKVLRNRTYAEQFMRNCRVSAALNHPNIPPPYGVGEGPTGQIYGVRLFIDGEDLHQAMVARAHCPAEVARIVTAVAGALDHAHLLGLTHGYVHPRHILLGRDGSPWLIGFGEFPPPDGLFGNPLHLAPEQFEAEPTVTPQIDVYQLAETAAWLLSGRHPFAAVSGIESLLVAKRSDNPWAVAGGIRADGLAGADSVLRRAMSPNPADRHQTPGEFAAAFAQAVGAAGRRRWWRFW